jgi:hypothetical protein
VKHSFLGKQLAGQSSFTDRTEHRFLTGGDATLTERLSPVGTDHITLTGRYRITLPERLHGSAYRHPTAAADARAA